VDSARRPLHRYVALGDSSTEGLVDPDSRGGYRGWSRRLAQQIADARGGLLYANLAVRGLTTRQVLETQLEPALALRPDLATVFSGTNDVVARSFDPGVFERDTLAMQRALTAAGATVLTFTLPDLAPLIPLARPIAPRILALNARLRAASAATGTILVDFAAVPVATDWRLWHADRIHANGAGHARIAAALAHALGLPGADGRWSEPLAPLHESAAARAARDLHWHTRYLLPWLVRRLIGAQAPPIAARRSAALSLLTAADRASV
jgi:lysophospholipase L1-like esterase